MYTLKKTKNAYSQKNGYTQSHSTITVIAKNKFKKKKMKKEANKKKIKNMLNVHTKHRLSL